MSTLPTQTLKPIASRIGRAMLAGDHAEVRTLCDQLADQFSGSPPAQGTARADARPPGDRERIGIWARDRSDPSSSYRRLEQHRSEWRLWADNDAIPTPLGRRRIVFLGESAARGYFYDPTFSPAVVLQRLFRRLPATQDVDVVDLARSNIDPAGIVGLARQSGRLDPKLFIVFAGNNWSSSSFFDGVTRGELIEALARHGYRGYVDVIEKWRALRTGTALNHLAGVADRADTPVIVVVPETNLLHWREDQALVVPLLGAARNAQWFGLASRARSALDAGRYPEAAGLASDLMAIDVGTSPVGPSIIGCCRVAEGNVESARHWFEAARDVRRALPLNNPPGCSKSVQDGLRRSSERHGFHVVDLPIMMRDRLDGALPDRRMFLDYCHLTSAGIRLLTEAVAAVALPLLGADTAVDLKSEVAELGPSPEVDADAHLMAAVHCARWGQSSELIAWHCAEALRLSPRVADKFESYLDAFRRSGPPWLGRRFPVLAGPRGSPTYRYFCEISPFVDEDVREGSVLDAMGTMLNKVGPPQNMERQLEIDLLSRRHFAPNSVNSVNVALRHKAFVEVYEPMSLFLLFLKSRQRFQCELTYRTPAAAAEGAISVRLNRVEVGVFPASVNWASVKIADLDLVADRNELAIVWPPLKDVGQAHLRQSEQEIRRNTAPNPLADFGDVHRLRLMIVSGDHPAEQKTKDTTPAA